MTALPSMMSSDDDVSDSDEEEVFRGDSKRAESGQRRGSKVIGVGVGQAYHSAGSNGFDGLVRITPDGKLHIHTGVGNLGTYSHTGTSRVAAEVLKYSWDNCIIEQSDPWKWVTRR